MMKRIYNWGILAPGHIARKFAIELNEVPNARLYAVGSRDLTKAKEFAREFSAEKYYGSYEALAEDPEIDIIYVASPHSFHKEHAILCLNNHKAVLCEKALALNLREVKDMINCAKENSSFLMEAMMVPQQPSYQEAKRLIDSGEMGDINYIQGWFGFNRAPYDLSRRLFNPALGGGALLDIGLYPIFDVLYFLGSPEKILADAKLASTGVDQTVSVRMKYAEGVTSSVFASFMSASGLGTDILCEKGTLRLRRLNAVDQWLEIEIPGEEVKRLEWKSPECGLKQEAIEVMRCLDEGKLESDKMPHSMSIALMTILDEIRKQTGVIYGSDGKVGE
jgi:predicted dehydrogenase